MSLYIKPVYIENAPIINAMYRPAYTIVNN